MEVVSRPPAGGEANAAHLVPERASDVELLGEMSHSGYREPPRLARRADGQVLQLTSLLYAVLEAIDGRRDLGTIAEVVSEQHEKRLAPEDVAYLINEKLLPLGVLRDAQGNDPSVAKSNPLLALRGRIAVSKPETTARLTGPFTWLFHAPVVIVVLATFLASVAWVLFERGVGEGLRSALYDPKQLVLVVGLTALSAGFHEFGHAAACRYGGARPGVMGAGLYLVWPAFYTDVTDSYRLDRRGRLRTDLGGLYFNCIFTVGTVAVAWATGADSLLVLVPLQLLQMVHQLVPILRLDGYHILADLTGVPDLYGRIRPTLRSAIPGSVPDERAAALRPGVRRTVTAWVVIVIPLLVFSIGSMALALPRLLATAMDSISIHWSAAYDAWQRTDLFAMGAALLSVLAILLPIAGTALIIQRIASRAFRYLWTRFDSPPARSLLTVAAVVTALALGAALWPRGNYRPIEPGERWIAQELPVVRAVSTRTLSPLTDPAGSDAMGPLGAAAGRRGGTASGRVVEGDDNLALAINTADGASIFRLAFAVRAITGEVVDQTNTAVALASCQDCSTVALAFQVLLVFDQSSVIAENRATAVNLACQACVTFAAATQLILGFDQPMRLTEEGERRVAELHQRLLALEAEADSRGAEALAAAVTEAKAELVDIFAEELVPVDPSATKDETTEETEDSGESDEPTDEEVAEEEDASSTESTTSTSASTTSTSEPESPSSTTAA